MSGGSNENDTGLVHSADDAKRPRRKNSKRSELELLLQLDGGALAASAEFRKANALRARDNILPGLQPRPPSAIPPSVDQTTQSDIAAGPPEDRTCL